MKDKVREGGESGESEPTGWGYATLEAIQRAHVRNVLEMAEHDLVRAAAMLEVEEAELRRLMKRLDIR
ncbi:MAG: hypothetical protein KBC05_17835 [Candidatus Hydrogenedentes bacterium]|nr:hypothetical protein [Candidatus Hydrogenedentota bacterium]